MPAPIPFGNYELLERIAEGGMAEVWRARVKGVAGFEKTVVVKRVLPSLLERPGFAELLVREAKIAARLSHPNIIQIFDLGEEAGGYFIAMELLRGRDLAAALTYRPRKTEDEGPLSFPLRIWIAAEVAKALDYAHRAKGDDGKPLHIVHRDVSPQNVLLGFEGEVKVADFGIARADEPGLGRGEDPKVLRGKYAYMSPEQARGEPLDRRSDLFSFGILLYELATKRRMFRGKTQAETLDSVRRATLPDYRGTLPIPELVPVLDRALAADKEDRYASAGEIHADLVRILFALGQPVSQPDLAAAMAVMFEPVDFVSPNKLRVDVLVRAYDDAVAPSVVEAPISRVVTKGARGDALTVSDPSGARARESSRRRFAFLAARGRPSDEAIFEASVETTGGVLLPASHGVLLAAYGMGGIERAALHAARGALELRRASRLTGVARVHASPATVIFRGDARVGQEGEIDLGDEVEARAAELLKDTDPDEIRVPPELSADLGREIRVRTSGARLLVDGFRARRERAERPSQLVARRELLRALSSLLIEASRGKTERVHLVGEAGVGKSRLLDELAASTAKHSFRFIHMRADEADVERNLSTLADLALDLCAIEPEDTPAERYDKVAKLEGLGLRAREARLVGELAGLAYPLRESGRAGRPRAVELALALRRVIATRAKESIVVLAIEDLQWMDDATRQVLPLLLGGLSLSRVIVLATRRPGGAGAFGTRARTIEVAPLDAASTAELLAHLFGVSAIAPELASLVHRDTGGIPAWIERVAEALRPHVTIEGGAASIAREVDVLPDAVRSAVAARIERLRPRDRSLLRTAALIGGSVDVSLLSAVEGLVGHTERPAIRRLLLRRLLVADEPDAGPPERLGAWGGDEDDDRMPPRVRVSNALLRRAVLAELGDGDERRLHARIVATLERLGASSELSGLERLAKHAARSLDPRRAPEYLVRAAELAARQGDRAREAEHLARAAELMREAGEPSEAAEHALRAAEGALSAGAINVASRALSLVGDSEASPALAVRAAILEARAAHRTLAPARAIADLERVRPRFAEVPRELANDALAWLGWAHLDAGELEPALEVIELALASADGEGRGRALGLYGVVLARADRLDEADAAVSDALALAARTGIGTVRFAALAASAVLLEARGELDTAAERYEEAAEVGRAVGEPSELAGFLCRAAILTLAMGDDARAAALATEAERSARELGQDPWLAVLEALRALLATRADVTSRAAVPVLVAAIDKLEALDRAGETALAIELLASTHQALGDLAAAARTLERAAQVANRAGHWSYARRLRERAETLGSP